MLRPASCIVVFVGLIQSLHVALAVHSPRARGHGTQAEELERLEQPISDTWGMVSHLHSVKNSEEVTGIACVRARVCLSVSLVIVSSRCVGKQLAGLQCIAEAVGSTCVGCLWCSGQVLRSKFRLGRVG